MTMNDKMFTVENVLYLAVGVFDVIAVSASYETYYRSRIFTVVIVG